MRNTERGASQWPFIITLLLLLGFAFLWYDQKGEADTANKKIVELNKQISNEAKAATDVPGLQQQKDAWREYAEQLSSRVGFQDAEFKMSGDHKPLSNYKLIDEQLSDKDGTALGELKKASVVQLSNTLQKPTKGAAASAQQIPQFSPAFKDKVREAIAAQPDLPPPPPVDPDNAEDVAKYQSELTKYKAAFDHYNSLIEELIKMPGWKEYSATIGETVMVDPDKVTTVPWTFWERPPTAVTTLQDFIQLPHVILRNALAAYRERSDADAQAIDGLNKSLVEARKQVDNGDEAALGLQQQLQKEQAAHTAETAKLQAEIDASRANLEKIRVEVNGAQAELVKAKESYKKELATASQEISAHRNREKEDKEKRDLEIARNEPDGTLLATDPVLGTGYIDLGSSDKVYPGLVFDVSSVGRGGYRVTKGVVVVSKVLDAHYSQVRVVSQVLGERPLTRSDQITNPFYSKSHPVHVYLAGDLLKYPKDIAAKRLQDMGVVIDSAVGPQTDWIVVPASMQVSPEGAPAPAAEAGAAKEESLYDKLTRLAKTFGATLVTERMIEHFLGY